MSDTDAAVRLNIDSSSVHTHLSTTYGITKPRSGAVLTELFYLVDVSLIRYMHVTAAYVRSLYLVVSHSTLLVFTSLHDNSDQAASKAV